MQGRAHGEHSRYSNNNRAAVAAAKVRKLLSVGAHGALRPAPRRRKTSMGQETFYNTLKYFVICYICQILIP